MATYPLTNSVHSKNAVALYKINFTGDGVGYRSIPIEWLSHVTFPSGKPNSMACFILAEIIYRHRACAVEAKGKKKQRLEKYFKGDKLQINYAHFMEMLGITKVEATRYCHRLEDLKLIKLYFKTVDYISKSGQQKKARNVMFIEVFPDAIEEITFPIDDKKVSTSKSIPSQEVSTSKSTPSQLESQDGINLKVETNTNKRITNKKNTNKKNKDQQSTVKSKPTASLPEETSPPSFPQNFEAEIKHNDKRLKGEKVMFTRKDNIYEGYVLNQSPRRLTIGIPEGHGLKNMVLNASGNSKMAYRNGKLHRVTWAAPDLSTGLPEPIRTVLKELKETIHPEILKTLNSKQFGYIKEFAIEGCKKGFLSPGRLSEFDNWYRNVKWAWLTGRGEEPSLITYWEIKKYIGHYNIWLQGGKVIPQSTGYKNGKTPFGQGYGLQTKPVAVEANDEVFIPEEF